MAKSKAVISPKILAHMASVGIPQLMCQIENAIMPLGHTQKQVISSVGSLRRSGTLKDLGEVTFHGRRQHLFSL